MSLRALFGALLSLVLFASGAGAEYPDRPVRLIVPFAAGGANDSVARLIANRLEPILGQSVVVENRPGGGTVRGTASVASASPDGYTLLLISPAHAINPYVNKTLPYSTLDDFTPISQVTRSAYVLVTSPNSAFASIADFRSFARKDSARVKFGSSGMGSAPHLAGALFTSRLGLHATHVPYQGGGPALIGVMRDDIDFYFSSVAGARPMLEPGKIRALAVSSDRRLNALPDVPTVAEAGLDDFAINGWYGLVGPANMQPGITSRLNDAVASALKDPRLVAAMEQAGEEVSFGAPNEFGALIKRDLEKYRLVVVGAGIEPR